MAAFEKADRNKVETFAMGKEPRDRSYWMSKTPEERLAALEFLRQVTYGYDPATARLQRVVELIDLRKETGDEPEDEEGSKRPPS